eukprot:CFRG4072T1
MTESTGKKIPVLKLDVVPGKSVGPFVLGMSIGNTIEWLKAHSREIHNVELLYSEHSPFEYDNVIRLTKNGIQLRFTSDSQVMKIIEIFDFSKLQLSYANAIFSSANTAPTFLTVSRLFGPSYPGQFDHKRQHHALRYPGLSFFFPIPERFQNLQSSSTDIITRVYENKVESTCSDNILQLQEPPLELPDGTTPVARRLCVYLPEGHVPPHISSYNGQSPLPVYYDKVKAIAREGIFVVRCGSSVRFGDSCQDVMCELGPPSKIYYKEEDKMRIHTGFQAQTSTLNPGDYRNTHHLRVGEQCGTHCSDYFYNYFGLGVDILFDAEKHTVKKIVLHTNLPCHFDFSLYHKCNFKVWVPLQTSSHIEGNTMPAHSLTQSHSSTNYPSASASVDRSMDISEVADKVLGADGRADGTMKVGVGMVSKDVSVSEVESGPPTTETVGTYSGMPHCAIETMTTSQKGLENLTYDATPMKVLSDEEDDMMKDIVIKTQRIKVAVDENESMIDSHAGAQISSNTQKNADECTKNQTRTDNQTCRKTDDRTVKANSRTEHIPSQPGNITDPCRVVERMDGEKSETCNRIEDAVALGSIVKESTKHNASNRNVVEGETKGVEISPSQSWADVLALLGEPIGLPVIFNRGSSVTPFGTTRFHGYDGVIFEVMRNGYIASVILFSPYNYSTSYINIYITMSVFDSFGEDGSKNIPDREQIEEYTSIIESLDIHNLFSEELKFLDLSERGDDLLSNLEVLHKTLMPHLRALMLNNNSLHRLPDVVTQQANISMLFASHNVLNTIDGIGNMSGLKHLNLDHNNLIEIPDDITRCKSMKCLYAQENNITVLPDRIGELENLEALFISNNRVTDLPGTLKYCTKMEGISLKSNLLQTIPAVVFELERLQRLHLARNSIVKLPDKVSKLTSLTVLDLKFNSIEKLPSSIGNLTSLVLLDCSHNKLRKLPEEIGTLQNLERGFFENNFLEELPKTLAQLTSLRELNVCDNNLTWVPLQIGIQASKFSAEFAGNPFPTANMLRTRFLVKPSAVSLRDAALTQVLRRYSDEDLKGT